ncbi:hypothetical protein ADZ36_13250 [Streptomyces fradiae]|uniref:Uncharacterized protein n=1 Tax=Streptomyces fradiae TaxID=1906 RepID=A0ACC4WCY8_STRFR|nr:hypothetical protein ADZ36_13250 [Streptomyces fradiae]OFA51450.1 hypothetical protein BEN35_14035 [Streptomyces fradiae]
MCTTTVASAFHGAKRLLQGGVRPARGEVAVADVVDEARVAVDGHEVGAPEAGQEERGDGEVLVRGLLQHGPGVRFRAGGHRGPPGARHTAPRAAGGGVRRGTAASRS